ncbi:MAG: hypothetical protein IJO25_02445 [Clostridia bacterium]|nr:hypothetical protein [Clostridia bacterium]
MLYLYKQISPNLDDTHYYFNTPTQYKNALASSLVKSVSLDNYRINTNVIKVTLDATLTETIADTLTYAIDERSENGIITYFRCYHVNRINIQSGFVILNCSVDLWASYLYKASITNLNVTRCNRNIGVGLLDDMTGTKGTYTRTFCAVSGRTSGDNNELWAINHAYIVFALKFNISQNSDGAISRIRLFAFNLGTLKALYYQKAVDAGADANGLFTASIQNPVELAKDIVSGIYGIKGYNGFGVSTTLNAVVLGAWFCPNISAVSADNTTIATKWHHVYADDIEITPLEVVNVEVNIALSITNDYDKQLYVGSRQNGLKLQRTTEATTNVNIKITPATDKLTIVAMQGDNQQDITQAFAVTLGTTDGDITAERAILSAFESATKIIGSGFALVKGATIGNAFAFATGAIGLSNSVADAIGKGRSNHIGGQINGGDGGLAFYRVFTGQDYDHPQNNLSVPITNPFVVNAYESINDEKANVRVFGAKFSELTTFASIFNASLLGTGTLQSTFVCAHCNVDNIPTEAGDAIKNKLQTGVYLVNLTA